MRRIGYRTHLMYCPSCLAVWTLSNGDDPYMRELQCLDSGCSNYLGKLSTLVKGQRLGAGLLAEIYLGAV